MQSLFERCFSSPRTEKPRLTTLALIQWILVVLVSSEAASLAQGQETSDPAPKKKTEASIYVWQRGDDKQSGTVKSPKKTLASAIDAARQNGVKTTIWLAGGVHRLETPVKLTSADSRTEETRLTIRSFPGKTAILTAGSTIPNDTWQPVSSNDRLYDLLPRSAREKVLTVDLSASPIKENFRYRPDPGKRQKHARIAWNGYILQQAQWPNKGYANIEKVLDGGPKTRHLKATEKPTPYSFERPTGGRFTVKNLPDINRLQKEFSLTGDLQVRGYLHNDWFFQSEMVGKIDASQKSIQLVRYTRYGIDDKQISLPRRFRIVNTASFLDQPGEWYYDHQESQLYLWPVKKPESGVPAVEIVGTRPLLGATDVNHIHVERLIFENFSGTAVTFSQSNHILVGGCTFRSGDGIGVRLGGTHNTLQSCDFHDLDGAAVISGIAANRRELIPEKNRALNNHIWNCRARGYGAFTMRGVGAYFAHNVMHHMNSGLVYGSNDFLAKYNEFYDMGTEMGDWNAAYNGADLSLQNNRFEHNFFHHLMETPGAHPIAAIRADDGASGLITDGNLFLKTGRAAVQFSGPNCQMTNNFVMGVPHLLWTVQQPYDDKISHAQFIKNKQASRQKIEREVEQGTRNFNDKSNIIAKAEAVFGKEGWKNNQVWIKRYPNFSKHFDFETFERCPWTQSFAYVKGNYMDRSAKPFPFHFHGKNPSDSPDAAKKFLPGSAKFWVPHLLEPNRVFTRPDQMDFRFRSQAKLKDGVSAIPFEKIGLITDRYRKRIPDKKAYRQATFRKYRNLGSDGGKQDPKLINQRFQDPAYLQLAE